MLLDVGNLSMLKEHRYRKAMLPNASKISFCFKWQLIELLRGLLLHRGYVITHSFTSQTKKIFGRQTGRTFRQKGTLPRILYGLRPPPPPHSSAAGPDLPSRNFNRKRNNTQPSHRLNEIRENIRGTEQKAIQGESHGLLVSVDPFFGITCRSAGERPAPPAPVRALRLLLRPDRRCAIIMAAREGRSSDVDCAKHFANSV
ncbi:hypothetical protein EVAR_46422_1 [Eumeta japonica]|uniref:Uncharacterized protein n=1 Tax=Eumeta variegata TaxID=151549 RepID=A0A4C1XCD9_EUMVA|nr:hypothetical protein EVAR_46422_1 [Eumeta japonica]